jgi:hypothetical protein
VLQELKKEGEIDNMSAKQDLIDACVKQLNAIGVSSVNDSVLEEIIKGFGPSAFNKDAQLVALSDDEEVERLKKSISNAKFGVVIDDAAIAYIKEKMTGQNRRYRVVVYYLLKTK